MKNFHCQLAILAGMDPTGGAGLLRDLWVCGELAPELEVESLCTALTRQCPQGRHRASLRLAAGPEWASELSRLRAPLWKLGLLPEPVLLGLIQHLRSSSSRPRLVCDPVLAASDGGSLGAQPSAWAALWPFCRWILPNRDEFLALGGRISGPDRPATLAPCMRGSAFWWIKSRVQEAEGITDEFHLEAGIYRLWRPRSPGPDPRGTGCALSTALAIAELGQLGAPGALEGYRCLRWEGSSWRLLGEAPEGLPSSLVPALAAMTWLDGARQRVHRPFQGAWQLLGSDRDER